MSQSYRILIDLLKLASLDNMYNNLIFYSMNEAFTNNEPLYQREPTASTAFLLITLLTSLVPLALAASVSVRICSYMHLTI